MLRPIVSAGGRSKMYGRSFPVFVGCECSVLEEVDWNWRWQSTPKLKIGVKQAERTKE